MQKSGPSAGGKKTVIIAAAVILLIAAAVILFSVFRNTSGSGSSADDTANSSSGIVSSSSASETASSGKSTDSTEPASSDVGQKTHTTAPGTTYTEYSAAMMARDFNSSYANAKSKYLNKNVKVTGTLKTVANDGNYLIMTSDTGNSTTDEVEFTCYLTGSAQKTASKATVGSTIVVSGKVTFVGQLGGYEIDTDTLSVL